MIIKHKYLILILIISIIGFFLRFNLSKDPVLHNWDERFHALVAKNLISNPLKPTLYKSPILPYDYKKWYSNNIWLHKQPLPLWFIMFSYKCFGITEFSTRIPSLIFSTCAIVITYLIGMLFFNKKVGLLSAFFMAINGLVVELASGRIATDHYDSLFIVFVEIAVLFSFLNASRQQLIYAILSGAFIGFAILTKWLPALIVIPIHVLLLLHYKSSLKNIAFQIVSSLLVVLAIILPWQLFILNHYPIEANWEYKYNLLHFTTVLDEQGGGRFYYIEKLRINYSEIIYIPLGFFIYKIFKNKFKDYKLLSLLIWVFIPVIFFSLAKTKMQGYIAFICPALFIITSEFFFFLTSKIKSLKNTFNLFFCWLLLFAIILLPIRYCYERTHFGFKTNSETENIKFYKKLDEKLDSRCVVINVKNPIELMFYTNCTAYSNNEISNNEIYRITKLGYSLFRLDEENSRLQKIN